MSILKQYDKAIAIFRRNYIVEKIEGVERNKEELVPESAFREAIANALVHRTWDVTSHIKLSMFSDRIEISSPGGLPRGLSKEEYLKGMISSLRNPIIANVFFRLGYIEAFGTGIRRIQDAYNHSVIQPAFTIAENAVQVILPVQNINYSLTLNEKVVLDVLKSNILMSSREIAKLLGWSKDKTIRVIKNLKQYSYIEAVGNGRATKYRAL
jgi:ATP-dependent DNA helicase RecG